MVDLGKMNEDSIFCIEHPEKCKTYNEGPRGPDEWNAIMQEFEKWKVTDTGTLKYVEHQMKKMEKDEAYISNSDTYKHRYEICKSCENFVNITKQCKLCFCFMPAKALLKKTKCPIGKWKEL